jgi:pilus assembly protein CpaC
MFLALKKLGRAIRRRPAGLGGLLVLLLALQPAFADDTRDVAAGVLRVQAHPGLSMTKRISMGVSKSLLVEFPITLRDVMVADPEKVDAVVQKSNRVFLIAKGAGQTNAFFFDENGQLVLTLDIAVGASFDNLEALLRKLLPGSNIKCEIAGNGLVLTGSVRTPVDASRAADIAKQYIDAVPVQATSVASQTGANAQQFGKAASVPARDAKIINLLSVEGEEQVMLRVTVAEVQRSLLKQLGVNLGAAINAGNFSTALLSSNALPLTAAAGLGTLPIPGISTDASGNGSCALGAICNYNAGPGANSFGNSGAAGVWNVGNSSISHAIRALERDGLIRTLAEPNLTAVSGEPAKFLAGGEYPIPVVDSDGKVSITYKEFGVGMAFTPFVLSEGRISLKIETEVSELTNVGAVTLRDFQIPALKKRQAKSTVELPSGGSLALAGLLSEDTRQNIDGFPGLKDLPVLGTLFRSRDFIREETELVVIVTPYVVRPTARQQLARPLDGLADPTDRKGMFLGHLNRIYGRGGPMPVGDLKGDYGFIVE